MEEVNSKPIGWLGRLLYRKHSPKQIFYVNSSVSVVECSSGTTAALLQCNSSEYHVFSLSREFLVSFCHHFSNASSKKERNFELDGVKIWPEGDGWQIVKHDRGMPFVKMSSHDIQTLGAVFRKVLGEET